MGERGWDSGAGTVSWCMSIPSDFFTATLINVALEFYDAVEFKTLYTIVYQIERETDLKAQLDL